MILKFMGSRNCLFRVVTILRDGGSEVRLTPEIRDLLSSYASVHSRAHLALYSISTGALYLGVMRLKFEAGN